MNETKIETNCGNLKNPMKIDNEKIAAHIMK